MWYNRVLFCTGCMRNDGMCNVVYVMLAYVKIINMN